MFFSQIQLVKYPKTRQDWSSGLSIIPIQGSILCKKRLSICFGMQHSHQSVYIQQLAPAALMERLKASFKAFYSARLTRTSKTVAY